MTFSAIVDADTLASALDSISVLVNECKIHTNDGGLEIRAVDPANVAMCDMSLDADAFESYEADGGVIGIDLERIGNVVSMADSGDLVSLELDEETRKLDIDIEGLEYTLALIDPDSIRQEPDIPDLDLEGTFVLEGKQFGRAIATADLCSDHIATVGTPGPELVFEAEGDTDDVEVVLEEEDMVAVTNVPGERVQSLFSLDYLKDIHKPIGAETEASLRVGAELPILLQYSKCDGDLSVKNLLAPRIQNDD